jgi:hypothetical protein
MLPVLVAKLHRGVATPASGADDAFKIFDFVVGIVKTGPSIYLS